MPRPKRLRTVELVERGRSGLATAAEWSEMERLVAARRDETPDEGDRFMFLRWGERRLSALHTRLLVAPESGNLFAVMTACALSLPSDGQRMTVSAAEIGRRLNLKPSQLSRALVALQEFDVLLLPEAAGRSRTFELDARLVTRMPEPGRRAAASSQLAKRRAASGQAVVQLVEGRIDDPRQAALLGDVS